MLSYALAGAASLQKSLGVDRDTAMLIISIGKVALILFLAWLIRYSAIKMIRAVGIYTTRSAGDPADVKRIETISRVLRYTVSVALTIVVGTLLLGEFGISVAPILGAAGVAGIALGFGAQRLVKDYFTGFFLLLENQISQGDVVEVAGIGGLVEEVTLRYVRLRDYEGNVHFIPNGSITTVTNRTMGFAFAVVDVGVAYRENTDKAMQVMRDVGADMRADAVFGPKILEDIEIAGVESLADSAVILRCRMKVAPIEQWNVRREFLRRIKHALDEKGIEIPYPHMTIYAGQDKDGWAPSIPLRINRGKERPLKPAKDHPPEEVEGPQVT